MGMCLHSLGCCEGTGRNLSIKGKPLHSISSEPPAPVPVVILQSLPGFPAWHVAFFFGSLSLLTSGFSLRPHKTMYPCSATL